jgi:laccase
LNIQIQSTSVKRLCGMHNIITVNGQFPGPTLHVRNGDTLMVKVYNNAQYNATIHWCVFNLELRVVRIDINDF